MNAHEQLETTKAMLDRFALIKELHAYGLEPRLTAKELSAISGHALSFIYQQIAEGHLKATRRGRSVRISISDAEVWMANRD